MARWLITGAGGFLGANAGLSLAKRHTTIGAARDVDRIDFFDESVSLDLLDPASIAASIAHAQPDVVLHCAALSSHESCERDPASAMQVNATATGQLAEAAAASGAKFVFISTDSVFAGAHGGYRETDALSPFSVYGRSKAAGEDNVRAAGNDHLIVRTNFFGWSPSGQRSILEFFVNALSRNEHVNGFSDFTVTSLYVQDLVQVVETLVDADRRGTIHVASLDSLTKLEFGGAVARQFNLPEALIRASTAASADLGTSRARNLSLSTDLLASWLNTSPPTQAAGIASAYDDQARIRALLQR